MIDAIPNRPLYFYQKDIIGYQLRFAERFSNTEGSKMIQLEGYPVSPPHGSKIWTKRGPVAVLLILMRNTHMLW